MTDAPTAQSFVDSPTARLLALLFALLIAVFLAMNWANDFRQLFAGSTPALPMASQPAAVKAVNPALQACLEQRVGDVDRMKEEGILSDAQYDNFKARAEELCRAQNPT